MSWIATGGNVGPVRSRRDALGAAIAFCGCALARPVQAITGSSSGPVRVNGRRVRTVDIHAHCFVPEALALLAAERRKAMLAPIAGTTSADTLLAPRSTGLDRRLAMMDAQRVDTEILSINPFWYGDERDLAAEVVRVQNEKLAELCATMPDRFAAFASLTLQSPDQAVAELDHAVRVLGLKGAAIGGHVNGLNFSDTQFHPVWAKAQELGVPLLIHPAELGIPGLDARLAGNGALGNAVGNPLGTTVALAHLIFQGTLDRFPSLKVCAAHGGGYLPSYAGRTDHVCRVAAAQCYPSIKLRKTPSAYLRDLYFDTLVFTPEALRHLVAEVGAGQVMLGTDAPYPWQDRPVEHVLATPGLDDADRSAILGGTAARLFRLDTATSVGPSGSFIRP